MMTAEDVMTLGVVLGSVGQGVAGFGEGQAATK